MKSVQYRPKGVCAIQITYDLDDENKIHNLRFTGGCNGNLKAISKLVEGMDAERVIEILDGNTCGMKNTSCADQLSKAVRAALDSQN